METLDKSVFRKQSEGKIFSKNKRMTAMAKVQEEAEAQGIEIPPIFSDIDEESGMPKLFTNRVEEASIAQAVEEAVHRAEADQQMQIEETPETIFSDIDVQTELEIGSVSYISHFVTKIPKIAPREVLQNATNEDFNV